MEFGFCYLSDYHPEIHGGYPGWYARLVREWQRIDAMGFDAIWIAEHRYAGYGFSSTSVVAQALASATSRVKVGTAVALISQRHPILTAEDWAAVDVLSGGRLRFGIGRGIYSYDFEVLGIPSSESRERFEEAWEVIRRLWSEDEVAHAGKHWAFAHHSLGPRPLQEPTPPVYVGCVASPESYVWAGRNGYHVIVAPFLLDSTERQREYLDRYREALAGDRTRSVAVPRDRELPPGTGTERARTGGRRPVLLPLPGVPAPPRGRGGWTRRTTPRTGRGAGCTATWRRCGDRVR